MDHVRDRISRLNAHAALLALLVSLLAGCMSSPVNGNHLPTYDSPITVTGFASDSANLVTVLAYDWCADRTSQVLHSEATNDRAVSSNTPTVFPGVTAGGGDLTGFPWSIHYPSITGSDCRYWSPYGCTFADWGPNQGTLRLKARITDKKLETRDAMVLVDPATSDSNLQSCIETKQRDAFLFNTTITPADAALACTDPDGFADVRIRDVTSTWAIDLSGMKILDKQDDDTEEPYNPVVVGFRGLVTPDAVLTTKWRGKLSEKELSTGGTYTLSDAQGRIHFRNVDALSLGEWLGCDPATERISVPEILDALDETDDAVRALLLFNSFRCDLAPGSRGKDITALGLALQAIESDATPVGDTVDYLKDTMVGARREHQKTLRTMGTTLQNLKLLAQDVIAFCNSTRTPEGYTLECIERFKQIKAEVPVAQTAEKAKNALSATVGVWGSLLAGFLGDVIDFLTDPDDQIGDLQLRAYLAVDSEFWELFDALVVKGGVKLPLEIRRLTGETFTLDSRGGGGHYVTSGRTVNFTDELRTTRLASERQRNAGRCPWTPPTESTATGTTL